jgi:transposase
MKKIPESVKKEIVMLRKKKIAISELVRRFEISKPTILKYCAEAGIIGKKIKSGRPAKLPQAAVTILCTSFLRKRAKSLEEGRKIMEKKFSVSISKSTVRTYLKKNKVKCYVKAKKPLLTERHKMRRMEFVRNFLEFSFLEWKQVIWSDECKFALTNTNNREFYWKHPSDPLQDAHVKKTLKFGGGSIIAWGCITAKGTGRLVRIDGIMTADKYITILEDGLLGTMEDRDLSTSTSLFMHNNDPKHTARRTKEWLQRNKIRVMDWPAQSPDMNPIENLWNIVDQKLRKRPVKPTNVEELWTMVKEEWASIDKEVVRKLYLSMTSRIDALKKAKGGYTRY